MGLFLLADCCHRLNGYSWVPISKLQEVQICTSNVAAILFLKHESCPLNDNRISLMWSEIWTDPFRTMFNKSFLYERQPVSLYMTHNGSLFVWQAVHPCLYDKQSVPVCMTNSQSLFVCQEISPCLYDNQLVPDCMTISQPLFVWQAVSPC